jgi:hypothetical protein
MHGPFVEINGESLIDDCYLVHNGPFTQQPTMAAKADHQTRDLSYRHNTFNQKLAN